MKERQMNEKKKFRGPWGQKLFIVVLSVVLGVLLYWILGFITKDIGQIKGPDYATVRDKYVVKADIEQRDRINRDMDTVGRKLLRLQDQQGILKDSTASLKNTMDQLLRIESKADFSDENRRIFVETQTAFLANQKKYDDNSNEIERLTTQKRDLEDEKTVVEDRIRKQEQQAGLAHGQLVNKHRMKIAVIKLAVLVPIFLVAAWFFMRKRTGTYWPIVWAGFIAVFIKISFVAMEYFPRWFFKYVAILVITAIVLWILIYLIRRLIAPKKDWLIKQYQEAYDKFRCPVCSKPIRTGPLRYVCGVKGRSPVVTTQSAEVFGQDLYTCPSCGTGLYDKCSQCSQVRHTLLPYCEHCGAAHDTPDTDD
jgi:predicted RNA-binding Zn-ribbon protein involved in translation (DUF1610 family)